MTSSPANAKGAVYLLQEPGTKIAVIFDSHFTGAFFLSACYDFFVFKDKKQSNEGLWEVNPRSVFENKDHIRIIDVRRPDEFNGELKHIEGAELVTLESDFQNSVETWNKGETIVFVCRSGVRSGKATLFAQARGFKDVYNMEGGMILWNELGLPVESHD